MNKEALQASVYNTAYYIGYIMKGLNGVKNDSMIVLNRGFSPWKNDWESLMNMNRIIFIAITSTPTPCWFITGQDENLLTRY